MIVVNEVEIAGVKLDNYCQDIKVVKSVKSFTNTCTIEFPKYLLKGNAPIFNDIGSFIFKSGDKVTVNCYYLIDAKSTKGKPQFTGFVRKIESLVTTVIIHCEDYMYYLKNTEFDFDNKEISLKNLGNKLINAVNKKHGTSIKVHTDVDVTIYELEVEKTNAVEILEHLQKRYVLDSFFVDDTLNIGVNFNIKNKTSTNHFFTSYPLDMVERYGKVKYNYIIDFSNLEFQTKDDIKYNIRVKTYTKKGKVKYFHYGDSLGQKRDMLFNGEPVKSEIDKFVEIQLSRIKYNGFRLGSNFLCYGKVLGSGLDFKGNVDLLDTITFDGIGYLRLNNFEAFNSTKTRAYNTGSYICTGVTFSSDQNGLKNYVEITNRVVIDLGFLTLTEQIEKGSVTL